MLNPALDPILAEIIEITFQNPSICYQCGKCSAGCPVRDFMEMPPNRVVRFVQLGFYNEALNSATPWLCAGCMTCTSRCPQEFELTKFMDALRQVALKHGIKPPESNTVKFHKAFLKQIENYGRSFELGMLKDYKMSSGKLFQDITLAPETLMKRKMGFTPNKVKNKSAVNKIFRRSREEGKK